MVSERLGGLRYRTGCGLLTFGYAEVGGPALESVEPATVDVVEACRVLEIGPVNGELVVRVKLALDCVGRLPDVGPGALQDVHSDRIIVSGVSAASSLWLSGAWSNLLTDGSQQDSRMCSTWTALAVGCRS